MLGMSHTVARVGEYSTITSACYRGLQYQNETYDEIKWDEAPAVNVTFHADVTDTDTQKVLLHRNGMNAPLASAAYIKFMSMFYGLEELAETLYNNIAKDYRCVAAGVKDLAMQDKYPSGAYISVINDLGNGSEVFASQSTWWKILANDAGSALLNISTTGNASDAFSPSGEGVTLDINRASKITNEAWAIIDTTWYDYLQGQTAASRVDTTNYARLSGASSAIYAIKKHNVFLTDKEENWNLRHSEPAPPQTNPAQLTPPTRLLRPRARPPRPRPARHRRRHRPGIRPRPRRQVRPQHRTPARRALPARLRRRVRRRRGRGRAPERHALRAAEVGGRVPPGRRGGERVRPRGRRGVAGAGGRRRIDGRAEGWDLAGGCDWRVGGRCGCGGFGVSVGEEDGGRGGGGGGWGCGEGGGW